MSQRIYFDLIAIIPLEEELHSVIDVFPLKENFSTDTSFRYSVDVGDEEISMLVVQQDGMGRTFASKAASSSLLEFDAGMIVCLGIAGALSNDMTPGDVCYTGTIVDAQDNSKITTRKAGKIAISLSSVRYDTERKLTAALSFVRKMPDIKAEHENGGRLGRLSPRG